MPSLTPQSEPDFVRAFEDCTLPGEHFRHRDHIRLARHYLMRTELPEALILIRDGIKRYASSLGVPGLYHETITFAFAVLINQRLCEGRGNESWEAFQQANADLFAWKPSLLDRHYSEDCLKNELSRRTFVWPDRAAF